METMASSETATNLFETNGAHAVSRRVSVETAPGSAAGRRRLHIRLAIHRHVNCKKGRLTAPADYSIRQQLPEILVLEKDPYQYLHTT